MAAMDCLVSGYRRDHRRKPERGRSTTNWLARMDELGLNEEDYWFLSGSAQIWFRTHHSGFGLGFERCVMYLTGMGNIRDVTSIPKNCQQL